MNVTTARKIDQLECAFEAHGYRVSTQPIEGLEELFADNLLEAFRKVERVVEFNARTYGFRGLSRNALDALHRDLPSPAWGVEIRLNP